jgi:virginiamycin B lyase
VETNPISGIGVDPYGHFFYVMGPDGSLWWTLYNNIVQLSATGIESYYNLSSLPYPFSAYWVMGLAAGPDGAMWFTMIGGEYSNGGYSMAIGRITTTGEISYYQNDLLVNNRFSAYGGLPSYLGTMTAGPDGALWFVALVSTAWVDVLNLGRITTGGAITMYPLPAISSVVRVPLASAGGALWLFTEEQIWRFALDGSLTAVDVPHPYILGITSGPDGALWFTEGNSIGRLDLTGSVPLPPTNLQATQVGTNGTQIQLTWDYGSDPIDGFTIQRKTPSGSWQSLPVTMSSTDRQLTDTVPAAFATYSYQILAYQSTTASAWSTQTDCFQLQLQTASNNTAIVALFAPDDSASPTFANLIGLRLRASLRTPSVRMFRLTAALEDG